MKTKNKVFAGITGIIILLLVAGLYIGTFKPPDQPSLGKKEYGVCIHIYQYDTTSTIQLLKQINASSVRIDWIQGKMDSFVNTMKDNNISILAILDHNTMIFQNLTEFTRLQWQETVQEIMSTEAAKKVDAWEIWNEPNSDNFTLGYMDGTPQNYFDMLKDAYQIIKTASPNATILAAGLSPRTFSYGTWNEWLTDFANLSPQEFFDFQGVHIYDDVETNLAIISETKVIIDKEIWITEIGNPSAPSNLILEYSPLNQASFLETNYQRLSEMKIPIFWYQLIDEIDASEEKEKHFGLFDIHNNPKPAVDVFIRCAS